MDEHVPTLASIEEVTTLSDMEWLHTLGYPIMPYQAKGSTMWNFTECRGVIISFQSLMCCGVLAAHAPRVPIAISMFYHVLFRHFRDVAQSHNTVHACTRHHLACM